MAYEAGESVAQALESLLGKVPDCQESWGDSLPGERLIRENLAEPLYLEAIHRSKMKKWREASPMKTE